MLAFKRDDMILCNWNVMISNITSSTTCLHLKIANLSFLLKMHCPELMFISIQMLKWYHFYSITCLADITNSKDFWYNSRMNKDFHSLKASKSSCYYRKRLTLYVRIHSSKISVLFDMTFTVIKTKRFTSMIVNTLQLTISNGQYVCTYQYPYLGEGYSSLHGNGFV